MSYPDQHSGCDLRVITNLPCGCAAGAMTVMMNRVMIAVRYIVDNPQAAGEEALVTCDVNVLRPVRLGLGSPRDSKPISVIQILYTLSGCNL